MSVKSFKFISPGIFINEIDNSQLPAVPGEIGPVVIGRTERGPAMRPVQVNSFSEFVNVFGNPIPGGQGGDVWRDGNYTAPTYAAYAAQAYLRNSNALTVVRLLGAQKAGLSTGAAGRAGWETSGSNNLTAVLMDYSYSTQPLLILQRQVRLQRFGILMRARLNFLEQSEQPKLRQPVQQFS
jgi:hypothetical protein